MAMTVGEWTLVTEEVANLSLVGGRGVANTRSDAETARECHDIDYDTFTFRNGDCTTSGSFFAVRFEATNLYNARFDNCQFVNVKFEGCTFRDTVWADLVLMDVIFTDCAFESYIWRCDKIEDCEVVGENIKKQTKLGAVVPEELTTGEWVKDQQQALVRFSTGSDETLAKEMQRNEYRTRASGNGAGAVGLAAPTSITQKNQMLSDEGYAKKLQAEFDSKAKKAFDSTTDDPVKASDDRPQKLDRLGRPVVKHPYFDDSDGEEGKPSGPQPRPSVYEFTATGQGSSSDDKPDEEEYFIRNSSDSESD
ncbi:hypothetical protein LTR36_007378 [Oleoguttula mirabilis]|uniref:Pentapeptide repeat-containing protein n=1 Tax=Oleoguttula mirabilis TaxID=1507867 RepID=A0AAV9JAN8_9PEZI|nr:hypothetical protein LTR36_007378 [Oleoguttula mirabilis]